MLLKVGWTSEADQRYAEATRLQPDYASAYNNWGAALSDWANILRGDAQQQCYAEADRCYAEATRLQPDYARAYNNWGNALSDWAHTLQGNEREAMLAKAEEVLLMAKEKGEKDTYNLACVRALQQRPDDARALLEEARAGGFLTDFERLSTDRDLDSLRELDWLKALLAEVRQQEAAS